MLVSRVCLGIKVFQINIERKGKEKLASVSTIYYDRDCLCCSKRCNLWKRTILKVDVERCSMSLDLRNHNLKLYWVRSISCSRVSKLPQITSRTIYCNYRLQNSTGSAIISQMIRSKCFIYTFICKSTMVEFLAHREVFLSYKNLSSFWVEIKESAKVYINQSRPMVNTWIK